MKFSIITPVYNSGAYIADTIESVLSQKGDFEIEYIIMDGGSTDNTTAVIQKYEGLLKDGAYPVTCEGIGFKWYSEKDHGMYDAINKGFAHATGDVYAWINGDDLYQPDALQSVAGALRAFPEIDWIKGLNSNIEADSSFIKQNRLQIYHQSWLQKGFYGRVCSFVEQDTVFWRAYLWEEVGAIPPQYRLAGDYWLWTRFAEYTKLWSLNKQVSIFRKRKEQMSQNMAAYQHEQQKVVPHLPVSAWIVRIFFNLEKRFGSRHSKFFNIIYHLLFDKNKKELYYVDISNGQYLKKKWRR